MNNQIEIYTDGSAEPKSKNGGFGAAIYFDNKVKEIWGGEKNTTNNRQELTAVIKALNSLLNCHKINLHVDSDYVLRGFTLHLPKWEANDWKIMNKNTPVKNVDLWKELAHITKRHTITWVKVKAHSGNIGNTLADSLADLGRESLDQYSKVGTTFSRIVNIGEQQ
jgi:ribonuclease HI